MTMQVQPRSVLQFSAGPKRGLLCQVLSVEGDILRCLSRDFAGDPHFFEVPVGNDYVICGTASLGPKPKQDAHTLPPPLNPQELLDPLPPEAKAVPMVDEADIPPAVPLPPPERKLTRELKRRPQPIFVQEAPARPALPPVKKALYTATVTNALGEQAVVTVAVPDGKPLSRCNGTAVLIAANLIPNVKPFTVTDWKPKTNETQQAEAECSADVPPETHDL